MSFVVNAVTAHPEHVVNQKDVNGMLKKIWPKYSEMIEQFSRSTTVETRHLTLPLNYYQDLADMGKRNIIWKAEATRLQKQNISKILSDSKINIEDIGLIASVTTTGLTVPSLEALMMNEFPFSPNTKRLPLFGLGCLAGVAGINRVNDYLSGHKDKAGLLLVTELCSLTFQLGDESVANLIGTTLFGDGSGAVLMVGSDHPLAKKSHFEILKTESVFFPDTERMMGWDMIDSGFQLVLSNEIPILVKEKVGVCIHSFLEKNKITKKDLAFYVAHPGGPKVLDAVAETLNIESHQLGLSWQSMARYGNASAASVINVLEETMNSKVNTGELGLMMAMGPAFALELSLIKKC